MFRIRGGAEVDLKSDLGDMYSKYPWGDTWDDALMRQLLFYLRGSVRLRIPASWKPFIPDAIPECGME